MPNLHFQMFWTIVLFVCVMLHYDVVPPNITMLLFGTEWFIPVGASLFLEQKVVFSFYMSQSPPLTTNVSQSPFFKN